MKVVPLNLLSNTTFSYDQTKTTLQGRIGLRTITDGNGPKQCLGVGPVLNLDVFDDTGAAPGNVAAGTANGRLFVLKTNTLGLAIVSYYQLVTTNGVTTQTWLGDLKFQLGAAANTYTIKGIQVDDSNPASMFFSFCGTHTVATNGGNFSCWGVNVTDFNLVSISTFPVATAANQTKTVYMMSDASTQAAHTMTVSAGLGLDRTNKVIYVLNGVSATPKIYSYSYTSPPASIPGANGYTNANYNFQTGTLSSFSGTIILNNDVQVITPYHTANSGSPCLSFLTTTNIYIAKLTDITSGVTTLPSLVTSDMLLSNLFISGGNTKVGQYIAAIDKWVFANANGTFFIKQCVNGDPNGVSFGVLSSFVAENVVGQIAPLDFGGGANSGYSFMVDCAGFTILGNTGSGQRTCLALDVQSDYTSVSPTTGQIQASIISPVISAAITQGNYLAIYKQYAKRTVYPFIQYRTSNFSVGPGVGFDATWTSVPKDGDLSSVVNQTQIQFRILLQTLNADVTNSSQITEAYLIYSDATQISSNWEGSVDNTSSSGASPMYVAFRQTAQYGTNPTKFVIKGVDDSGNVVYTFDTITNAGVISQSNNNGTSWVAWTNMAGFYNTALTTELRVQVVTPSGTRLTWSIQEG